jgi:hypothetical protein
MRERAIPRFMMGRASRGPGLWPASMAAQRRNPGRTGCPRRGAHAANPGPFGSTIRAAQDAAPGAERTPPIPAPSAAQSEPHRMRPPARGARRQSRPLRQRSPIQGQVTPASWQGRATPLRCRTGNIQPIGAVREFKFVDPHASTILEVAGNDAAPVIWNLEGDSANSLMWDRWSGQTLTPADERRVTVEPLRSGAFGMLTTPRTKTEGRSWSFVKDNPPRSWVDALADFEGFT